MKKLNSQEELAFYTKICQNPEEKETLSMLLNAFTVLQTRSQMLFSLIALCLTITGFSGPKIAAAHLLPRLSIILGLVFVLLSSLFLMLGPMKLQWVSQYMAEDFQSTAKELLHRRDHRTELYRLALISLIIGLSFYVLSVVSYLWLGQL